MRRCGLHYGRIENRTHMEASKLVNIWKRQGETTKSWNNLTYNTFLWLFPIITAKLHSFFPSFFSQMAFYLSDPCLWALSAFLYTSFIFQFFA